MMTMRRSKIKCAGLWLGCVRRAVCLFASLVWRRVDPRVEARIDIRLAYQVARGWYGQLLEDCGLRESLPWSMPKGSRT